MGNVVKLVFNAVATGSGFSKMYGDVKGLASAMPGLTKATMILGSAFGSVGASVGRMATMLLQGSIWGVAAEGARLLIEKFGLFKDKTEETKEKLDKLEEATRKFYETINANSQKSLERIDKETKRRHEQLDITNRMIKAELQLQKTRAIASGDTASAERIDRQMTEQDQATSMSKAVLNEQAAAARYRTAEGGLDAARKQVSQIEGEIDALKEKIFYQHWDQVRGNAEANFKATFGQNARFNDSALWNDFRKNFRYSEDENNQIKAARERLALAEKNREAQRKAADEARESYKTARENVKALRAEQEAANESAIATRMAEGMKAEKERVAKEEADEKARLKKEADEEAEFKKKQHEEALRQLEEEWRTEKERRKKALQEDIAANSRRATDLQQKLADATARANAAHDIFGNAGNMDQGGGVSAKRREWMNNRRFAEGAADLIGSGKIRRGPNGEWLANGRLSNLNQAILERLNADERKRKLEKENDKVVKKLDELKKAIEQMSTL